jgi:hypothetical protein
VRNAAKNSVARMQKMIIVLEKSISVCLRIMTLAARKMTMIEQKLVKKKKIQIAP